MVKAVQNFGAGDILEIAPEGTRSLLHPLHPARPCRRCASRRGSSWLFAPTEIDGDAD